MRPGEIAGATVSANVESLRHVDMSDETLMPLEEGMQLTIDHFREIVKK
jgi:hypothetical protein